MKPGHTGLTRLIHSFSYSRQGLCAAWKHEAAFRQEVALALALLPATFWLARTLMEWLMLVSTALLVMLVELLNSGIEAVVDRISAERHPLAGRAKDLASAAVLIATCIAGVTWCGLLLARCGLVPLSWGL